MAASSSIFPGSLAVQEGWSLQAGTLGFVFGFVTGLAVGWLQWLAVSAPTRVEFRLLLSTGLSIGITHAVFDASSFLASLPIVAAVCGLAVAGAHAGVVGVRAPATLVVIGGAWTVGLVLAGLLGDATGVPLEETPLGWATDRAFDGVVVGIIRGAATATTGIMRVDDRPIQEPGVPRI